MCAWSVSTCVPYYSGRDARMEGDVTLWNKFLHIFLCAQFCWCQLRRVFQSNTFVAASLAMKIMYFILKFIWYPTFCLQLWLGFARWLPAVRVAFQGATDNRCSERQKPQAASFPNVSSSPNIPTRSLLLFYLILMLWFFRCPLISFMVDTCWQWNMETMLHRQRVSISRFLTIKLV